MVEPTTAMALAQGAGSLLSAGAGIFGSKKSAKIARQIAAMQLAWERERAQNSIQWGVQDALKAGINPAVAAGAPATTSAINPPMPDTKGYAEAGNALGQGLANTAQTILQDRQTKVNEQLGESQSFKNVMEGLEAGERTNAIPQTLQNDTRNSLTAQARQRAEERHMETENKLLQEQTTYQIFENSIKEIEKEVNSGNFGRAMAYIDRLTETVKGAGGAIGSFIPTIALWKGATTGKELLGQIKTFKNSNAFKILQKSYSR